MPRTVTLLALKAVATSTCQISSDSAGLASQSSSEVSSQTLKVLGKDPNPTKQSLRDALTKGESVLKQLPGLVVNIQNSRNEPDPLYLTLTNNPGNSNRIWPVGKKYEELYSGIMSGKASIVIFGDPDEQPYSNKVMYDLDKQVDISLWAYSYSNPAGIHLGSFRIDKETEPGNYVKTVIGSDSGSIYIVAYVVK